MTSARLARSTVVLAVGIVLGACRGASDGPRDASAAAERSARGSVTIGTIHHLRTGDAGSAGPPFRTELADGSELEVREMYLVIAAVELHACVPERDSYDPPAGPSLNAIDDLLIPAARAHVASSSNRLGTPVVEPLSESFDSARIIGELAPPAAAYCRVAVVVAPADRDVLNPTSLATDDIVGASMLVRGRHRPEAGGAWKSFEWRTEVARAFEFPARDPATGESPLVVRAGGDGTMLLVDKRIGVDAIRVDPSGEDPAAAILERIGESMAVYTY